MTERLGCDGNVQHSGLGKLSGEVVGGKIRGSLQLLATGGGG